MALPKGDGADPPPEDPPQTTWEIFVERVRALAEERGRAVSEVLIASGHAADNLNKPRRKGPTTGMVEDIAQALGVAPAALLGWDELPAGQKPASLRKLAAVANIASHLYVAFDSEGLDPAAVDAQQITELVMRAIRP
jgi:hypothetical protein